MNLDITTKEYFMKNIKKADLVETAHNFAIIREQIRMLEQTQKIMRQELIEALGDQNSALIGEYLIILSERIRTDLDKDALQKELGDKFQEFLKQSTYSVLDVRKA